MKKTYLLLLIIPLVIVARIRYTRSYFSDTEKLTGNTISAGVWSGDPPLKLGSVLGVTSDQGVDLRFFKSADGHSVGFSATGDTLSNYQTYSYTITYDSDGITQGMTGSGQINGKNEIAVDNLVLGICSTGGICVYHPDIKNLNLSLTLSNPGAQTFTVTLPD
jgi:hypothetical protein